jgi:ferredoxin/flavodoxin
MSSNKIPEKIRIVYFSGTGGCKRVANIFADKLQNRNVNVNSVELNQMEYTKEIYEDMLIIIFPVYALNAPKPIYQYLKNLTRVNKLPAVVISVSGGGEITPNTASRLHSIKLLKQKGFQVIYEEMLVMPSNVFFQIPEELSWLLLNILPEKIERILIEVLQGRIHITKPLLADRILSRLGEGEKLVSGIFGKRIKVLDNCNGCKLCEKACPCGNIIINNKKPYFDNQCVVCLRCIYNCPKKALRPGIGKSMLLKQGYDLNKYDKLENTDTKDIKDRKVILKMTKGFLYSGIKKYLLKD